MRVLRSARSSGSAAPVEEFAGRRGATGAGAPSRCREVAVPIRCSVRRGAAMTEHAVVIAGGGPTGLMLAGELALAGIDVVIVERRASQESTARAPAVCTRAPSRCSISAASPIGSSRRGRRCRSRVSPGSRWTSATSPPATTTGSRCGRATSSASWPAGSVSSAFRSFVSARWRASLQDDTGVDVELSDGPSLRADYLVGCDGGRSLIRKAAGIDFPGWDPTTSWLIAEVEMDEEPELGLREGGGIGPGRTEGPIRVVLTERHVEHTSEPTLQDLSEALVVADGTDYGVHSPTWISRFTDMTRQAASYRKGRVLLAGDAAHVHPPQGGQGLNTGVQDAVNLGWKLAQVVNRTSPESLLDTYHAERHPVGARVLHNTMAQVALSGPDERHRGPARHHDRTAEHGRASQAHRRRCSPVSTSTTTSERDTRCSAGACPTSTWTPPTVPLRVFTLLHDARPVLLNLGEPGGFDISPWADRVRLVDAGHDGVWELPVLGEVAAPPAVLIRPDGHVAWVGDLTDPALPHALETWFGAPTPAYKLTPAGHLIQADV